ncbi:MAG TPA: 3-isopropylmalate dehydratase large subunit [Candidatus Onthenecus intestinigallinarum]|uniref:3-isopropylmalate dehydratase large subunit n=1 Tax=Candidatus Onthenecus intestinigallinarum TaxID=2840875 RepID=A0A9D0Z7V1_9FIRM|nr:3-isopropylmalate dehydratase large subunit [Candidatus Onthenecus intestinigallinarum]
MGMTMTQKILARAAGVESCRAGELLMCNLDLVLGNDITGPVAINEFYKMGAKKVFDPAKVVLVPDHFAPNKDIKSAQMTKDMRAFAREQQIVHYFEVGKAGIEHALLPEQGLCAPGEVIIGADSHTCTYGALGCMSTGVGSTDMAAGMATGQAWFKVPEAVKVTLTGKLNPYVSGKDVILHLIGLIGVDGARYMSLEFGGDGVKEISMDGRLTIANMAIEAGAKNGIFPVDDVTRAYLAGRVTRPWQAVEPDPDAEYAREVVIDLADVPLTVALPHLPSNTKPAAACADLAIDQAVIGSCTNGRIEDLRAAAQVLRGHQVSDRVRCIVIPGTQQIVRQAIDEGLVSVFIDAGAIFTMPTCGPCLGGHCGVLADGERCVSTTNRNFVGRMGHTGSEVILASPAVAAASAVLGRVATPDEVK